MSYTVKIKSIATDGVNIFTEAEISDGATTMPPIYPIFPSGTDASEIDAYFQTIADAAPTLDAAIVKLVAKTYEQA